MCVAKFTDWYEITWHLPGTSGEVTARFACTFAACCITTVILSLRPVVGAFKWLLEPDVQFAFSESSRRFELQRERPLCPRARALRTSENRPADPRLARDSRVECSRRDAALKFKNVETRRGVLVRL